MAEKSLNEINKYFLLAFTKELIINSTKEEIFTLNRIIEKKQEQKLSQIKDIKKNTSEEKISQEQELTQIGGLKKVSITLKEDASNPVRTVPTSISLRKKITPMTRPLMNTLIIPEPKLPPHLEYLKPLPTKNSDLDLMKINPFIKDPSVRVIIGNSDEKLVVSGAMGTRPTDLFLNKEDVNKIINQFSKASKIPARDGIYRVVVGNLNFSAIISSVIGSKFVIKKMSLQQTPPTYKQI